MKHRPFKIEGQSSVRASLSSAVKDCRVLRGIQPTEGVKAFTEQELGGRDGNSSNLHLMPSVRSKTRQEEALDTVGRHAAAL